MILSQKRVGDFVILRVGESRIDAANAAALQESVSALAIKGSIKIILDLSSVLFMDSCGLAGLVPAARCLPAGGCFKIAGLEPKVEQIFKLTKLDTIFEIFSSVDEAMIS